MDSSRQNRSFLFSQPVAKQKDITAEMITIWKNEKFSKNLLPYEETFIGELLNSIQEKEQAIKNLNKEEKDLIIDLNINKPYLNPIINIILFK